MASVRKRCDCAKEVSDEKQKVRIWKKCNHSAYVYWRNGGRGSRLLNAVFKRKEYGGKQWGAAERWAAHVDGRKAIQEVVDKPRQGGKTFREVAEKYLEERVGKESTTDAYRYSLRNHVFDADVDGVPFGDIPEGAVSRDNIKTLVKRWTESFAPNTVAAIYIAVSAVFTDRRKSGAIKKNPCSEVTLPEHIDSRVFVSPTLEQLDIVASRLWGPWQLAPYLGHAAGLRCGEALAVRLNQLVEGDEGWVLRINRQVYTASKLTPLKHRKADEFREIPVTGFLHRKILEHAEAHSIAEDGFLTPGKAEVWEGGAPYPHRPSFYEALRDGLAAAELPDAFMFQWLRHDFASRCIQGKPPIPLPQVAKILGHRNSATTERVYWHLLQGSVASARETLDRGYVLAGYAA